jgi:hypothetical protein
MSKIYHLDELEEFYGSDQWRLQIDVSDIWNNYNKKATDITQFNSDYRKRLMEYKTQIAELGNDVWNELVPILNKMTEKKTESDLFPIYDDIYSWGDQNDVLIKTK